MISCVEGWKKWVHKCPSQKLRWNISAHSVSVKAMSSAAEQKNTAKIGKNQLFISKVVGGIIALILCLYSLGCGPTYFRIFEFVTRLTALWRVFCATLQFAQLKIQALTHTHPHTHFCNAKRMQEGAWQTCKRMCMCVCCVIIIDMWEPLCIKVMSSILVVLWIQAHLILSQKQLNWCANYTHLPHICMCLSLRVFVCVSRQAFCKKQNKCWSRH